MRSRLISSSLGWILTDQTENTNEPLLSMVNDDFSVSIWSSWLKIGFLASDPPTDLLFSGSKGRDLPLTVIDVGSTGSRAGSNGLGWWVKSRFCLDTPSLDGSHILMFMLSYRLT